MVVACRDGWTKRSSACFQLVEMCFVVHGAARGRMGQTGLVYIGWERPGPQPGHKRDTETVTRVISP